MKKIILFFIGFLLAFLAQAQSGTTNYGTGSGTQGSRSSFFGENAGRINTANTSSFFGNEAGYNNTSGYKNCFFGLWAGYKNTTGYFNSFFGAQAGLSNTTGVRNTFIGLSAGIYNTTGSHNTFVGLSAGSSNTTGNYNLFFGVQAGYNNTVGTENTFMGYRAGFYNTAGNHNVFIGNESGFDELGSDKLYIANNRTTSLIYGDFAKEQVIIGGVQTTLNQDYKLGVLGKMIAEEVRVTPQASWPDYVFEKDYALTPLNELENQIQELGHLPNIPNAKEVEAEGWNLGDMDTKLLEKVEELTLYIIDINKTVGGLKEENQLLKQQIKAIQSK